MLHRLTLLGAAGALLVAPTSAAAEAWLTTAQLAQGYAALALDGGLGTACNAASPVRLHGIVASPSGSLAVAVGRRPGQMALAFDRDRGGTPGDVPAWRRSRVLRSRALCARWALVSDQ